ncbi:MAG: response regulator transcription factor [Kiritimatiellales bacterium]
MAHILIIDDDPSVQFLFQQFFESEGFTVTLADDGKEGIWKMKQEQPDLVITDIMMPEMDGLEVIQEIRQHSPELPVIAISGGMRTAPLNFLPHAKKFGACRVFGKPVSLAELLAAVRELLAGE